MCKLKLHFFIKKFKQSKVLRYRPDLFKFLERFFYTYLNSPYKYPLTKQNELNINSIMCVCMSNFKRNKSI